MNVRKVAEVPKSAKKRSVVSRATHDPAAGIRIPISSVKSTRKRSTPNFTMAELTQSKNIPSAPTKENTPVFTSRLPITETVVVSRNNVFSRKIIATTQVVGMGLALFGVCFAFMFASGILPPHTQNAEVIGSVSATTSELQSVGALLPKVTTCPPNLILIEGVCINPKPPLTFSVPGDHTKLQGIVPVEAIVESATRVKLSVYHKESGASFVVGPMIKTSEKIFSLDWQSKLQSDGTYYLRALVENKYGSYEISDTATALVILNTPPIIQNSDSITTTSATSSVVLAPQPPIISSTVTESSTEFKLSIKTGNATKVTLYSEQTSTTEQKPLGTAYRYSDTEWRFLWSLGAVPEGQYRITAQVLRPDNTTVQTNSILLTKLSATETSIATTTPAMNTTVVASTTLTTTLPDPAATASVFPTAPVHGIAQFKIQVAGADAVKLYAQNSNGLVQTPLGIASKKDTTIWITSFDTTTIPDGEYTLVAAISNSYGTYENRPLRFTVKNRIDPVPTPAQSNAIIELTDIAQTTQVTPPKLLVPPATTSPRSVATATVTTITDGVDRAIASELDKLAVALRSGDALKVAGIKANIESLTKQVIYRLTGNTEQKELNDHIAKHVSELIARTESNVITIDRIISDRTGDKASKDSDTDGIPDFDEVTIYKTNPFVSDTDNDGFFDGAEIMSGYDPLDVKTEAYVAYESPKVAGIEQKDLLAVTSITTAAPVITDATTTTETVPAAIISGKAPANSYVTLYIFSTPIVVTIKTDSDGGWNYHFDKELENGVHEVYVGVTDNAGKIVAKSAPFSFIKTAEAYSGQKEISDAVATPAPATPHNLLSSTMLYILFGFSIVVIGLVLMLIGTQLDSRRNYINANTEPAA